MRTELLERYNALPLPTTTDEAWRFTDLKGFDPYAFGQVPGTVPRTGPAQTMLDIAVSGLVHFTESALEFIGTHPVSGLPPRDEAARVGYAPS